MKKFISDNWIILVIGIAFVISTVLAVRNNYIIEKNHLVLEQTDQVKQTTQAILMRIMHGLDLGVRGFGLTHDDRLLIPYNEAIQITPGIFKQIDSLLTIQNYPNREEAYAVMTEVKQYTNLSNQMIAQARNGDMEAFVSMLKEDRGYQVWSRYSKFSEPLFQFEDNLAAESLSAYQFAIKSNLFLQFCILVFGLPMLYIFVRRVNTERRKRVQTLKEVDNADKTFVFDNGEKNQELSEQINIRSVDHIKEASSFIAALAEGDYDVQWKGLNDQNKALNQKTLAGNLFRLRNRLKVVKTEDERRNWTNEGLAKFSEIVRTYQHESEELGVKTISFLTKYLNAQQGSLFVLDGEEGDEYLKLVGCYAFDRRKFIDKRIDIGSGLVGQAYLEGEPILLKEVPQGYTQITSGLGTATPPCMAIIPMKQDTRTIAIVEFASFTEILPYQISFLQKAGEFLASAIMNTRTTAKMKALLDEATIREAMMREREEELKQNMEELQATQEQLARNPKEKEMSLLNSQPQNKNDQRLRIA